MKRCLIFLTLLTLLLGIFSVSYAKTAITIGYGTNSDVNPFNAWYGHGRSLGLYTFDQIGQLGMISSLGWEAQTAGSATIPYKIYAKLTTDTELAQMTWADFTDTATLVKEGSYAFNSFGWHQFALDNPILYTGGNLLIGVEANYGGSGAGTGGYPRFYYTSGNPNTHQRWARDHNIPTGLGTLSAKLPNLMMLLSPLSDDPLPMLSPSAWDYGRIMIKTSKVKAFNITNAGGGTLEITSLSPISDSFFEITDSPILPLSLSYGQSATFSIQYAPLAVGDHTATFTINAGGATAELVVSATCYDPTISNFPYSQDFDGIWSGSPVAPEDWIVVNANNDDYTWNRANTYISPTHSSPYAAHGMGNTDDWLITPPFNLNDINARVKWWDRVESTTRPNSYKVMLSTTTPDIVSFTTELADIVCDNTDWTEHTLNLDSYNGQTIYLAFHQYASPATNYGFGIDDFLLEEIPTAPVLVYNPDTIDFGVFNMNTASVYQNVTVSNIGIGNLYLTASDILLVGAGATMFEIDSSNLPTILTTGSSVIIPVRYNPAAIGTHSPILRITYEGNNHDVALSGQAVGEDALLESFEDAQFPPPGWYGDWRRSYSNARHGSYCAYKNGSTNEQFVLSTPMLTIENHSTLSFWTLCPSASGILQVVYSQDRVTWNQIGSDITYEDNIWHKYNINLSSLSGNNYYIGFRTGLTTGSHYVDMVVGPNIAPLAPGAPVLTSPADEATYVSVTPTFTWNVSSTGGLPTSYKIYCDANTPPTTIIGTSTTPSFTLENALPYSSTWYWSVTGVNANGEGIKANPRSFTVMTDPTVYAYPFHEGFEDGQTHNAQVTQWTQHLDGGMSQYWMANSTNTSYYRTPRNGDFNATLRWNGDAWLTRPFSLQGGQSYDVEVWARQDGDIADNASVGIYYGADGTLGTLTNIIKEQTGIINGDYQRIKGNFTPPATGVYWIGIHGVINGSPWYISIDDFSVRHSPTIPELVYEPANIDFGTVRSNMATTYQNVAITNNGGGTLNLANAVVRIIGTSAAMFTFDPVNLPFALTSGQTGVIPVRYCPTAAGTHNAILRMVYNGTFYDVALSGNAVGENALLEGFEGALFPPLGWSVVNGGDDNTWIRSTTTPRTGEAHARIDYSTPAHDDWLITPKLAPSATNHTFSFYGRNRSSSWPEQFNVLVSTTDTDIASFTAIATNVDTGMTDYIEHSYDLSSYINQEIYVAIQAISAGQWALYIDDVSGPDIVVDPPAVPVLVGPADGATLVPLTPTLTWNAGVGGIPSGYKVYFGTDNPPATEVADVNTQEYTFTTDLQVETVYYWTVKAYNSAGMSDVATPFSFTTIPEGMFTVGKDTTANTTSGYPAVYGGYYQNAREQYIITADELTALGGEAGNFASIAFNVESPNTCVNLPNFTIKMGTTTATGFVDTNFIGGLREVFSDSSYTPTAGWNTHVLDTPFSWDGISNIVIQTSFDKMESYSQNASVYYTSTSPAYRSLYYCGDNTAWESVATGFHSYNRPNMMLQIMEPINSYPWSENFDSLSNGQMPDEWAVIASHTGSDYMGWRAVSSYVIGANSSPNAVIVPRHSIYPKDEWMITPPILMQAGLAYDISFAVRGEGWDGVPEALALHWGTEPNVTSMMSNPALYDNSELSYANWTVENVTFVSPSTGIYYFGWHAKSQPRLNYIAVDDVSITEYYDPTVYAYPFSDGFEVGQTDREPVQDWIQRLDDSKTQNWMANSTQTDHNRSPRSGSFNATLQNEGNAWLMRSFFLEAGHSYDVEVWARQDGSDMAYASVGLYYGTRGTIAAMVNIIRPQTAIIDGDYQQIKGSFTAATDGLYWIGIHGVIDGAYYISIDDIAVQHATGSPLLSYAPSNLEFGTILFNNSTSYQNISVANYGIGDLHLNAANTSIVGEDASMFEIDPNSLPITLSTGQSASIPVRYYPCAEGVHSATLRFVDNSTNYDVSLSGKAVGLSAVYESFESAQFPPSGWLGEWSRSTYFSHHGIASAYRAGSTTTQHVISLPLLTIEEDSTFSFWALSTETGGILQVVYSQDRVNWTQLGENVSFPEKYTWHEYTINLSSLSGGNYYLGLRTGLVDADYYVDMFIGPNITPLATDTITIGDGSVNSIFYPIFGYNDYTYTQQIYTQAQVNHAGEITKLRFYYVSGDIAPSKDWNIYMGHTQKTSFASNINWENPTNLTQVFSGDVSSMLPEPNNWMEITLQTPFVYNNVDNLLIAVHQYTTGGASMSWGAFDSGSNTGMCYYNRSSIPDPIDPPAARIRSASINYIQLDFRSSAAPMAPLVVSPENGAQVLADQPIILSWTLPLGSAYASGYDVYLDGNMISSKQLETSYAITEIELGEHSWFVVAHNDMGSSAPSEISTFKAVYEVYIGTGTAHSGYPFNSYNGHARSLGLYTAEQIGWHGAIHTLGWSVAVSGTEPVPYKIYAKLTNETSLTAMTWDEFTSTAILVKEGSYNFDSEGWHTFALDTPFDYTGGNLLIGVETNYGSLGAGAGAFPGFHFTDTTACSHQFWRLNNSPPMGNGTLNSYLPNLYLTVASLSHDPTISSYPWTENFDSVEVDQMPECWTIISSHSGADDRGWKVASDVGAYSEPQAAVVHSHDQYAKDEWMISLPLMMEAGQAYYVSFRVKGMNEALALHWGTEPNLTSMTENVALYDNSQISYANWTEERVMFIPATTGVYYFGWHAYTPVGGAYLAVDNISIVLAPDVDLMATGLSVPSFGYVGTALDLSVTVKNWGGTAQTYCDIYIKEQGTDNVLAQEQILDVIDPNEIKVYTINWTPTTAGNISIYAEVDVACDADASNNVSTVEQVLIYPANMEFLYVGDPSSTLAGPICPFNLFHEDFVAETVYLANEIQATGGELQAIAYYNNFPTAQSIPVQIWMQNTDAMSVRDGWLPWDGYQLVFDGTIECPAGFNEIVIPITHFNYTGNNLAIRTSRTWDGSTFTGHNWLLTRDSNYSRRTRIYQANISDLDHTNPTAGAALDMVPNINFYLATDGLVDTVAAPVVEVSISETGAELEWELIPYAHSYNVYTSEDAYNFGSEPAAVIYGNSTTMSTFANRGFYKVTSNTYRDFNNRDVVDRLAPREFIVIDDQLWAEPNVIEKAKSGFMKRP